MPGERCAVAVCNNSRVKTREFQNKRIVYHRFPKDEATCKQWIQQCKRADTFNFRTSVICSDHFNNEDYVRDLKSELLNTVAKRNLKPGVVPTVNLGRKEDNDQCNPSNDCDIQSPVRIRENKNLANELPIPNNTIVEKENNASFGNCDFGHNSDKQTIDILQRENYALKQKIALFENKIKIDSKHIKKLKKENQYLKRKHNKTALTFTAVKKTLSATFTENQLKLLFGMKKQIRWTAEEISLAFTLRYFSKRCYLFLKRTLKIPLPGISTLQRWATTFEMRKGLLGSVFQYLEVAKSTLKEHERVTVLQFDEMKVRTVMEYDTKHDEIVGPHSSMQVILARGLFAKWKQPVYINFDTQVTKDILNLVIHKLNEVGYNVKACVSDMEGGNIGLWKELGITKENTYFTSSDGIKVHVFADTPHILKLIRNWLLDTGFQLSNGKLINKEPIGDLIKLEENEDLKTCFKLTENHINVEKTQRQNVKKASQLLSHSTAAALKFNFPNSEQAASTSEFIELTNNWFDLMNSYKPNEFDKPFQKGYGQDLEEQKKILSEMLEVMITMRCCGKKSLQTFQKGCIISIISLQELYNDLKNTYNIKYVLTHRLNQDSLENLFSQIRTRGGLNDHPSPLDALFRIRMIVLGKTQGVLQKNTNTNNEEDDSEFVVSKVLKATGIKLLDETITEPNEKDEVDNRIMNENTSENSNDLKSNALEYLAGWVAKKQKTLHPHLEDRTRTGKDIQSGPPSSWLGHLSYGGLTCPSSEWLDQAKCLNAEFEFLHKNSVVKGPGVVTTLTKNVVQKYPEIPLVVANTFVKQRTFIRLKFLNQRISNKRKNIDEVRKTIKKYKKIVS